jgi:hypothetical protein
LPPTYKSAPLLRVPEQPAHPLRRGIGGDVEVLGLLPQQRVADAPAGEVRHMSRLAQPPNDRQGVVAVGRRFGGRGWKRVGHRKVRLNPKHGLDKSRSPILSIAHYLRGWVTV